MQGPNARLEWPDRLGLWLARVVSKVRLPEWMVTHLTQPTMNLILPVLAECELLREALETIAGEIECENVTGPPYCRDARSGRRRDSKYGFDRWCDVCIARDALANRSEIAAR